MEKLPPKPKKNKSSSSEELLSLDKNVLVEKIIQLEAHNLQLKNIIAKNLSENEENEEKPQKRPFDFSKCRFRKVLLRILYFGWDYQGLAVQEDTTQTIEHHLFKALTKSCLIQSRETSNYHRCGRTDKGVSSFGQVISISLRSKYSGDIQNTPESINTEISYCKILNRLLPKEIRAVGWMAIPDDKLEYSARFDCTSRTYKYYFPKSSLNITAMESACQKIIGNHDFRNLCKMDVGNGVVEFRRTIMSAELKIVDGNDKDKPTSMYYLQIKGNAFLWHQIRCIMGILLLVGEGKESPSIFDDLLDVENHPRKPQYNMALDIPLNLFHCGYELEDSNNWIYEKEEIKSIIKHLQAEWTIHSIKTTMLSDALHQLEREYSQLTSASAMKDARVNECEGDSITAHTHCLLQGVKPRVYTPLMKRQTCSSLEERIDHYRKRRKVDDLEKIFNKDV